MWLSHFHPLNVCENVLIHRRYVRALIKYINVFLIADGIILI